MDTGFNQGNQLTKPCFYSVICRTRKIYSNCHLHAKAASQVKLVQLLNCISAGNPPSTKSRIYTSFYSMLSTLYHPTIGPGTWFDGVFQTARCPKFHVNSMFVDIAGNCI